ncbi:uncharacterized protein H6S33_009732 [Morchella sextelata]|uniref:uncharacterized protein n=1 Tax=Morchella sextelata TaxID=1174677 RepID=UPI001D058776|nr:uncharacterized protein H6S33_009732 [Morchella sextelata]KAH0613352.1 hypothetical protein H6S33_009732 [Morchella sextelata]
MLPHLQRSRPTITSPNPPVTPPLTHTRPHYNPAIRHPAFFTERLHKAPSPTGAGGSSPVTAGYAYVPVSVSAPKAAGAKL